MKAHLARLAGLTAVFAALCAVPAHAAQFRVGVQIGAPPPVFIAPPPVYVPPVYYGPRVVYGPPVGVPYGYEWQPGYYVWTSWGRRWVPGAWVRRGHAPHGHAYGYWRNARRWR
jgi:hypothetical protein